ncbi:hypothetical protein [Campylobacter mucosalis]|uniref:hypothetical protein n=1 Tax=Campylobacter mucosalis TaxID=202 RepID=UPI001470598E|nr:hypothetical protein [Campylobacter mucosalis]
MRILLIFAIFSTILFASVGSVTSLQGKANIIRDGKAIKIKNGDPLEDQDAIEALDDSIVTITFDDGSTITLGSKSKLDIQNYGFNGTTLGVTQGSFRAVTSKNFILKTATAQVTTASGAEFLGFDEKIIVLNGKTQVSSNGVVLDAVSGNFVKTSVIDSPVLGKATNLLVAEFTQYSGVVATLPNGGYADSSNSWGSWGKGSVKTSNANVLGGSHDSSSPNGGSTNKDNSSSGTTSGSSNGNSNSNASNNSNPSNSTSNTQNSTNSNSTASNSTSTSSSNSASSTTSSQVSSSSASNSRNTNTVSSTSGGTSSTSSTSSSTTSVGGGTSTTGGTTTTATSGATTTASPGVATAGTTSSSSSSVSGNGGGLATAGSSSSNMGSPVVSNSSTSSSVSSSTPAVSSPGSTPSSLAVTSPTTSGMSSGISAVSSPGSASSLVAVSSVTTGATTSVPSASLPSGATSGGFGSTTLATPSAISSITVTSSTASSATQTAIQTQVAQVQTVVAAAVQTQVTQTQQAQTQQALSVLTNIDNNKPRGRVIEPGTFTPDMNYLDKLKTLIRMEGGLKLSGSFTRNLEGGSKDYASAGYVDLIITLDSNDNFVVGGEYVLGRKDTVLVRNPITSGRITEPVNMIRGKKTGRIEVDITDPTTGVKFKMGGNMDPDLIDEGVIIADRGFMSVDMQNITKSIHVSTATAGKTNYSTSSELALRDKTDTLEAFVQMLIDNKFRPFNSYKYEGEMDLTGIVAPTDTVLRKNLSVEVIFGKTNATNLDDSNPATRDKYIKLTYDVSIQGADGTIRNYQDSVTELANDLITYKGFNLNTENGAKLSGGFIGNGRMIDGLKGELEIAGLGRAKFAEGNGVAQYVRGLMSGTNTTLKFASGLDNIKYNNTAVNDLGSSIKFDVNFGKDVANVQDGVLHLKFNGPASRDTKINFDGGLVTAKGFRSEIGTEYIQGNFVGNKNGIDSVKGDFLIKNSGTITGEFNAIKQP